MGTEYRLSTPLQEEQVRQLKLGDTVYLSGEIVLMAGSPTFERMLDLLRRGETPPVMLENSVIFHGPSYNREIDGQYKLYFVGVTSSYRFEEYMPELITRGKVRAVMGKGGLGKQTLEVMKEVGCVYLALPGASVTLVAPAVKGVTSANWLDLIAQFRLLTVNFEGLGPATVAMDAHGNSIYEDIKINAEKKLPQILKKLSEKG